MSYKFKGPKVVINGQEQIIIPGTLPSSPTDGHIAIDSADNKLKVYKSSVTRWIILGDAEDVYFSLPGFQANNVRDALGESKATTIDFQFIGLMNYNQYLVSGRHINVMYYLRSGNPSNGARYQDAAPNTSPYDGAIYEIAMAVRGVAQSNGSPSSVVNVNFELWSVGMTGSEGTKLGDIVVPISSSTYTIGNYWDSSVVTNFEGGNNVTPNVTVSKGQLLGLKFISKTGSNQAVSVENVTISLGIRPA